MDARNAVQVVDLLVERKGAQEVVHRARELIVLPEEGRVGLQLPARLLDVAIGQ